jgi:antitoxin YefM
MGLSPSAAWPAVSQLDLPRPPRGGSNPRSADRASVQIRLTAGSGLYNGKHRKCTNHACKPHWFLYNPFAICRYSEYHHMRRTIQCTPLCGDGQRTTKDSAGRSSMETSTLDISEARKQFTQLDKRLREDRVIWITRHNKKAFAVVDTDLLQTVLETIEILSDPDALRMLQEGLRDIQAGRLHDHEDVKSELLSGSENPDPVDRNSQGSAEKPAKKGPRRPSKKGR